MSSQAIGLFDSGVGGLSVLSVLKKSFPNESFIYIGDTKRAPYGDRSIKELWSINQELVNRLLNQDIKALVLACNTSCALFLTKLQKKLEIPVIGLIPAAAKCAVKTTKTGRIAVLGTTRTIEQQQHKTHMLKLNSNLHIFEKATPELVPIIEKSLYKEDLNTKKSLESFITILQKKPDTLIHGCTHYPILEPFWKNYLKNNQTELQFINPANAIIKEIQNKIPLSQHTNPTLQITCTGDPNHFDQFIQTHYPLLNLKNLC